MALPSNLSYTLVTGRFLRVVTDTADGDNYPDGVPATGLTVTFTPQITPARVKDVSATPPTTIVIDPIVATTDSEGDVVSNGGHKGVYILSSNDPDINPSGWTYKVTVAGTGFTGIEFSFIAQSGATMDLSTLVPVPANPGTALTEWQLAVAATDANADRAEAAALAAEDAAASVAPGDSAYQIAVDNGFVGTEAEWLESLAGADGNDGDPGRYVYADSAEFLADTQTRVGYLAAPTGANWQVDLGTSIPSNVLGPLLTQVQSTSSSGTPVVTQWVTVGSSSAYPTGLTYARRKSGAGAWSTWSNALYGTTAPTGNYELTSKYYVDQRSVANLTETEFNTLSDAAVAFGMVDILDFAAFTGISEFEGGGKVWFEHQYSWTDGVGDVWGVWYQKLHLPDSRATGDGSPLVVERHRRFVGPNWEAWSAWAVLESGGAGGAGLKTYASTAEIDAVVAPEEGIYRFPVGTMSAYFGAAGADIFYAGDVYFTTYLSDNYGSGFPPTGSGRMDQRAVTVDGYGSPRTLIRSRGYNTGTSAWLAWGEWSVLPLPNFRPTGYSLWGASGSAAGVGDGWVSILEQNGPTQATSTEAAAAKHVAQVWSTWFNDASSAAIEGGKLQMKSASFEFQGILDGTRTDVGTVAFASRSTGVAVQTNRVVATASAAATDAVAGFHIPVGIFSRPGLLFHATFAMQSGITSNTRLLCGMVATADVATAMTDVEPSAMQNFYAMGYGSSGNIFVYQKATSTLGNSDTGRAPSTSTDQILDFRAYHTPNSGTLNWIAHIRTSTTLTRMDGTLGQAFSNSAPLSFFIRASAGGTSAAPAVALHRLRVGAGFGTVGGS